MPTVTQIRIPCSTVLFTSAAAAPLSLAILELVAGINAFSLVFGILSGVCDFLPAPQSPQVSGQNSRMKPPIQGPVLLQSSVLHTVPPGPPGQQGFHVRSHRGFTRSAQTMLVNLASSCVPVRRSSSVALLPEVEALKACTGPPDFRVVLWLRPPSRA